ncbi:hypothetical protein NPIL_671931 [Nephila pilipes]|uniref:Uncharacterized protein n=1 Tax=Nephila pilipes TaxID=299642 RepID=A0A8X6NSD2_NEPPI|nr:hypothetical protein NPIL_671931 [Nephila pilipes]
MESRGIWKKHYFQDSLMAEGNREAKSRSEISVYKEKSDEKNRRHTEEFKSKYKISEVLRKERGSSEKEKPQWLEKDRKHLKRTCGEKKCVKQKDSMTQMEKRKVGGFTVKNTSMRNGKWFVKKETMSRFSKKGDKFYHNNIMAIGGKSALYLILGEINAGYAMKIKETRSRLRRWLRKGRRPFTIPVQE